jgi:L-ascorbate metabolism protein UlaG (beta-lactamase superfamily)
VTARSRCSSPRVVDPARRHGFHNVTALKPWEEAGAGGVIVTATPAKHGVYEVTFVLRSGPEAVYFAGDTMLIPELGEIPQRLGHISLAPAAHQRPSHPPREQHAGRHERPTGVRVVGLVAVV